jgi:hypothetical protein
MGRRNVLAPPRMEHSRPAADTPPYRVMHRGALLINCLSRPKTSQKSEFYIVPASLLGQSLRFLHCANLTVRPESHSFTLCQLHC